VASFIGENNLIPAASPELDGSNAHAHMAGGVRISALNGDCTAHDTQCIVSVRPEKMLIKTDDMRYDNELPAHFIARHYVGDFIRYYFRLADGHRVVVKTLNDTRAPEFTEGQAATVAWRARDCFAFQTDT